jgi:hypothetical protein
MAVPRVVPQHNEFKNLDCQTALSAYTKAKGILPRCKTEAVTTPGDGALIRNVVQYVGYAPKATILGVGPKCR